MTVVAELAPTVGILAACAALALARATYYRVRTPPNQLVPAPARRVPRALSEGERKVVVDVLHEPRFVESSRRRGTIPSVSQRERHCRTDGP